MTEPGNTVSYNGTDYRRPPGNVVFGIGHESANEERWGFACTRRDDLVTAVNAAIEERHTLRIEQGNVDNDYNLVKAGVTRDKFNKNDIAHCKQDFDRLVLEGRNLFNKLQEIVREIDARKKHLAGEILNDIITAAETEGEENALKPLVVDTPSAATPAVADTLVAAPAADTAAVTPNAAEIVVTPPAVSALQTIATAANALTAPIVDANIELEKLREDVNRLKLDLSMSLPNSQVEIMKDQHRRDMTAIERDRDKYRSLCSRIEGIMKDRMKPSTTQDVADVVKSMKDGITQLEEDIENLKSLTKDIGDILTTSRLDSEGKGRMKAIQALVHFQDEVISKLECETSDKAVDEILTIQRTNKAMWDAIGPTRLNAYDNKGSDAIKAMVGEIDKLTKERDEINSQLQALQLQHGNLQAIESMLVTECGGGDLNGVLGYVRKLNQNLATLKSNYDNARGEIHHLKSYADCTEYIKNKLEITGDFDVEVFKKRYDDDFTSLKESREASGATSNELIKRCETCA
jgi:hypothetical protein